MKYFQRTIVVAGILLTCALLTGCPLFQPQGYTDVSVSYAYTMWDGGTFTLDVRTPAEYAIAHIPSATNIDVNELQTRIGEIMAYQHQDILVYCGSGVRSAQACEILVDNGFTQVYNMLGGLNAWINAGYPTDP